MSRLAELVEMKSLRIYDFLELLPYEIEANAFFPQGLLHAAACSTSTR